MKILYKSSRLISAAIVGGLVLAASAAIAVTKEPAPCAAKSITTARIDDMGRFVITPKRATYAHPVENVGRIVISQHRAMYLPSDEMTKT